MERGTRPPRGAHPFLGPAGGSRVRDPARSAAEDLDGDLGDLGRRAADADALGLERLRLRLGRAGVPETIAPAWPIVLPGGAVKPAM